MKKLKIKSLSFLARESFSNSLVSLVRLQLITERVWRIFARVMFVKMAFFYEKSTFLQFACTYERMNIG